MARKTVADLLVDVLAEAGVRQIYGVSGDSLNGITDLARQVVSLSGDGGLAMLMGDMLSLQQLNAPAKITFHFTRLFQGPTGVQNSANLSVFRGSYCYKGN